MPVKIKKWNSIKKAKGKEEKEKENKKRILFLLILVILLGILVGVSFAKYQAKITGKAFASIAEPILEVRREQSLMLTALAPKASYVFEVRNFKENELKEIELNQIEMEYYIEIISHTDDAIKFELFQGDKQIPLNENKTEKIKLTKDEKKIHSYRLEITYDKTKGQLGKDINENVEVKIHSIQKA